MPRKAPKLLTKDVTHPKVRHGSPFKRWDSVTRLVELCVLSTIVENIEAPLNCLLVGPPGDGKTKLLLRFENAPHVEVLSDATWNGLVQFVRNVKDGFKTCVVIPDLGTLVGRKSEVAKQSVATLAMLCAEGVRNIRVGKRFIEFGGARASVLSAVTLDDLARSRPILEQNAFLSRVFLIDFDLSFAELSAMLRKKNRGDRSLIAPITESELALKNGNLAHKHIGLPEKYAKVAEDWWREARQVRGDRFFGFRTADALTGLLMASARKRNARSVSRTDVKYIEEWVMPLFMSQVHLVREQE